MIRGVEGDGCSGSFDVCCVPAHEKVPLTFMGQEKDARCTGGVRPVKHAEKAVTAERETCVAHDEVEPSRARLHEGLDWLGLHDAFRADSECRDDGAIHVDVRVDDENAESRRRDR